MAPSPPPAPPLGEHAVVTDGRVAGVGRVVVDDLVGRVLGRVVGVVGYDVRLWFYGRYKRRRRCDAVGAVMAVVAGVVRQPWRGGDVRQEGQVGDEAAVGLALLGQAARLCQWTLPARPQHPVRPDRAETCGTVALRHHRNHKTRTSSATTDVSLQRWTQTTSITRALYETYRLVFMMC